MNIDGQLDLDFKGSTYNEERDHERLSRQAEAVWRCLRDERWWLLSELAAATNAPEASCSARIRDIRRWLRPNGTVKREYVRDGLHRYRAVLPSLT